MSTFILSTRFWSTLCFVNSVLSTVILSNHEELVRCSMLSSGLCILQLMCVCTGRRISITSWELDALYSSYKYNVPPFLPSSCSERENMYLVNVDPRSHTFQREFPRITSKTWYDGRWFLCCNKCWRKLNNQRFLGVFRCTSIFHSLGLWQKQTDKTESRN